MAKISGPLLDRIDMHLDVPALPSKDILSRAAAESSSKIKERTTLARRIQQKRFDHTAVFANAQMNHQQIQQFCATDEEGGKLLMANWNLFHLTFREKSVWKYGRNRIMVSDSDWLAAVGVPKRAFGWRDLPTYWRKETPEQLLYYYAFFPREISRLCRSAGFQNATSWVSTNGRRGHWWQSGNILTIAYA